MSPEGCCPQDDGVPGMAVSPGRWYPQDGDVPGTVVSPGQQCPQNSGVPRAVLSPGQCRAGQDVLCGAGAVGAADSAAAPRVSCLGGTRGAAGTAGPGGGLPSRGAVEAPVGPPRRAAGQAGLRDWQCGRPHVLPVPCLLWPGLAPVGWGPSGCPCGGSAGARGCAGAGGGRKRG